MLLRQDHYKVSLSEVSSQNVFKFLKKMELNKMDRYKFGFVQQRTKPEKEIKVSKLFWHCRDNVKM